MAIKIKPHLEPDEWQMRPYHLPRIDSVEPGKRIGAWHDSKKEQFTLYIADHTDPEHKMWISKGPYSMIPSGVYDDEEPPA